MIARVLTIIGLLLAPVLVVAPQPAAAQAEGSLYCSSNQSFTERWRTHRYYGTDNGQEYENTCQFPIKFYFCVSYDPNPESCATVAQFRYYVIAPGGKQRIYPTARGASQYIHNIQCGAEETLVDWRSQFTQAKGPRCKSPMPANVNRSPYPGSGTAPNPAAPLATLRTAPSTIANNLEYPYQLLGTLAEGRAVVLVGVDASGRPTGCSVKSSSGFYLFDKGACDLFAGRLGRYLAAKDASGTPVPSVYEGRVTWTTP